MASLQELKDYCDRVGIKYHPNCKEKTLKQKIAKGIDVPIEQVEDVISRVKNKEQRKEEIKKTVFKEPKKYIVRVLAKNNYEIEGLFLESNKKKELPKQYLDNERFMKKLKRQIEIKKIEWVD